jgi:hypothetical protein
MDIGKIPSGCSGQDQAGAVNRFIDARHHINKAIARD